MIYIKIKSNRSFFFDIQTAIFTYFFVCRPGQEFRQIIQYRDLDAPQDPIDMFN